MRSDRNTIITYNITGTTVLYIHTPARPVDRRGTNYCHFATEEARRGDG